MSEPMDTSAPAESTPSPTIKPSSTPVVTTEPNVASNKDNDTTSANNNTNDLVSLVTASSVASSPTKASQNNDLLSPSTTSQARTPKTQTPRRWVIAPPANSPNTPSPDKRTLLPSTTTATSDEPVTPSPLKKRKVGSGSASASAFVESPGLASPFAKTSLSSPASSTSGTPQSTPRRSRNTLFTAATNSNNSPLPTQNAFAPVYQIFRNLFRKSTLSSGSAGPKNYLKIVGSQFNPSSAFHDVFSYGIFAEIHDESSFPEKLDAIIMIIRMLSYLVWKPVPREDGKGSWTEEEKVQMVRVVLRWIGEVTAGLSEREAWLLDTEGEWQDEVDAFMKLMDDREDWFEEGEIDGLLGAKSYPEELLRQVIPRRG